MPDLDPSDPCSNLTSSYIPSNVTRQTNLPSTDYNIIALAPWINRECTRAFLASADLDPIRAFIFYYPDNKTTLPYSNHSWSLHDGGEWKQAHRWPVYGIPGAVGQRMIAESSKYSGNMTSVPNGSNLTASYDKRDYVRIYTQISTNDDVALPGLWIFLLVIAAVLIVTLTFISLSMHLVHRRRRYSLRRRVANGEVNLEALGIKRLRVPRELIDKFPLYIYTCDDYGVSVAPPRIAKLNLKRDPFHDIQEVDSSGHDLISSPLPSPTHSNSPTSQAVSSLPILNIPSHSAVIAHTYQPDYQPTCPICLDDFESSITTIRELPCGHIYHPECIDSFLTLNSSLCPLCKKSVLPVGYCPAPITNAVVRRELMVRRIRSRVDIEFDESDTMSPEALLRRLLQLGRRVFNSRVVFSPPRYQLRAHRLERIPSQTISSDADNRTAQLLEEPRHGLHVSPSNIAGEASGLRVS